MSRDQSHAKVSYDWFGSWTTLYNLYADAQLCFHLDGTDLSPDTSSVYERQRQDLLIDMPS